MYENMSYSNAFIGIRKPNSSWILLTCYQGAQRQEKIQRNPTLDLFCFFVLL